MLTPLSNKIWPLALWAKGSIFWVPFWPHPSKVTSKVQFLFNLRCLSYFILLLATFYFHSVYSQQCSVTVVYNIFIATQTNSHNFCKCDTKHTTHATNNSNTMESLHVPWRRSSLKELHSIKDENEALRTENRFLILNFGWKHDTL